MKRKLLLAALCVVGALGGILHAQDAGTYYIKNVGAGLYWGAGNNYGTQASLVSEQQYVTLAKQGDGTFTMESMVSNSGNNIYFNGSYMDNNSPVNLTFTEVSEGVYTIANGATYYGYDGTSTVLASLVSGESENAQWKLLTQADIDSENAATLASATSESPVDATFLIKDGYFGRNRRDVSAWTIVASNSALAGGGTNGGCAESYHSVFTLSQVLTNAPKGVYKLGASAFYRQDGTDNNNLPYIYITDGTTTATSPFGPLTGTENDMNQAAKAFNDGSYVLEPAYIEISEAGDITVGAKLETNTTLWCIWGRFTLTYYGSDKNLAAIKLGNLVTQLNDLRDQATELKANAAVPTSVKTALTTALSNSESIETTEEAYNNAIAELTVAVSSANDFVKAKSTLDAMKAVVDATNFYTAEARETYYGQWVTKFESETLTNAEAQALQDPRVITSWRASVTVDNFLLSVWDTNPDFPEGVSYYINTWSAEGETDGSSFTVPFFEYWTGDGDALGTKTLTGTMAGLDNGEYTVSALVRVRAKNGTDATAATGITMDVNGATATDVTEGTAYGQFNVGEYNATALVKDGNLYVHFNVASDNNISWLSFKNVKYVKNRDLTAEEMAVAPTAITLKKGEEEVNAAIALDATTNTVTLTAALTPADATEGYISWTSSDGNVATVADGVVTGVAPGTATITATSTLDNTVSATATVTVTYPETAALAAYYVNDGASRTNYTPGENLIKNGAFEYPNTFYGWTAGNNAAMSTAGFTVVTDNGNTYVKAKNNAGGGDASTFKMVWPIENGKEYIFTYKVKGTGDGTLAWDRTSLTNALGDETKIVGGESISITSDWKEIKYEFKNDDNYSYIQFFARWHQNVSYDDFYLCEGPSEVVGNVDYATAVIPTSNIGTGAFQYSQDAINEANALVQGTATVAEVEAAYDALTTLNAPAANTLYNVVNITSSYAYKDKALTFQSKSDADLTKNTTSMGWLEEPGAIYPQGVKFTAVPGVKNGYTMSYTRADGNVIYVSTGKTSGLGDNTQQIRPTTDPAKALTVQVQSAGDNKWYLLNTEDGHSIGATDNSGFYTNGGANKDVRIQEAVNNEVSLNIAAANQYGTLILPFDATVPSGVTAYACADKEGQTLTLEEVDAFKANTPYIVYAEEGATETLAGLGAAYTDASYTEGYLTGVYAATLAPVDSYVLQNLNSKVAFYQVAEGEQPTVGANRAYLTVPSNVKAFFFPGEGEATAIEGIEALTAGEYEAIYTLGGVKVNALQKGVNVVRLKNGKTVKVNVK